MAVDEEYDFVAESEEAPTPVDRHASAPMDELQARDNAITGRYCAGCKTPLPPCDCAKEVRGVATAILETLMRILINGAGFTKAEAAAWANFIARENGITLL